MEQGWIHIINQSVNTAKVKCDKCQTESIIQNLKSVEVFCCPKCQKIYSKTHPEYSKINGKELKDTAILLPLGSECTIDDVAYKVVGCANKHEKGYSAEKWQEYVLIDNNKNYAFINCSYGHWTFMKECPKPQNFNEKSAFIDFENTDGLNYKMHSSYYQITEALVGEFPYDVIDVKRRFTREFVNAPRMFTYERWGEERTYFTGHYMTPKEVRKSFGDTEIKTPGRSGIGSCQPFYFNINPQSFQRLSFIFFAITFVIYLLFGNINQEVQLVSNKGILVDSVKKEHIVSRSFTLFGPNPSLLKIVSHSSVDNDWIEADMTLVNEKTGEEKFFSTGIEYYHGYSDGESWSEGSTDKTEYLNNISPGTYHLDINVMGSDVSTYRDIQIMVYKDYPTNWNYWLLIIVFGCITFIVVYFGNRFENARFGNLNDE